MKSYNNHINLITIILLLFSCSSNTDKPKNESSQHTKIESPSDSIYVTQVLDGDTFILSNNKTVRIVMIDTPEINEPLYKEASDCLSNLILNRTVELILIGSGKDRYNRILAEVMLDTTNIGRRILYNGLAVMYVYPNNKYLIKNYLPAQLSAIDRQIGLWSLPEPVSEDYYLNISGSYRFHRPLCSYLKNSNPAKLNRYKTRLEALKKGLSPCRSCKP